MLRWKASLVWFRRDLRDFDHAALHLALKESGRVFCAFVFDHDILDALRTEPLRVDRRLAYIHAAVVELDAALRRQGGRLIVLHARAVDALPDLARDLGVEAVYANRDYEPQAVERDALVAKRLRADGRHWVTCKDQVIFDTDDVLAQSGQPFSVFTPYKRAWLRRLFAEGQDERGLAAIQAFDIVSLGTRLAAPPPEMVSPIPSLPELGFARIDADALPVPAGMSGGQIALNAFLPRIGCYDATRDFPALDGTSHLSVHLRFGTVSIRTLVREAVEAIRHGTDSKGATTWLSELIWREFYFMILHHHPRVISHAFKPAYDAIRWENDDHATRLFDCWCMGRTGYPLIDAAMIHFNGTGFMHNRLRMVTASFLIKDLGIDWRWGERYFAEKLNDFDLAANNGGWQWVASSGCDAQPYFRIFNPVTQSRKFDPEGAFIKRILPQLGKLDAKTVHAPWLARPDILRSAGIVLGDNYPQPIVDHERARRNTLARYAVVKAFRD